MAAKSPVDISDATLRFTVKAEGNAIKDYYPVVSVYISHELNKVSYAEVVLVDGTVESGDFPISDSNDLIPGNTIEITAGYGDDAETSIFKGYIVKQSIRIEHDDAFHLVLTCKHKAVTMTYNKNEAQFSKKTDSDIIKSIIGNYGLSCTVDATSSQQDIVFQKMATDWDFILARAEYYGYVISLDDDKVIVGKPATNGSAVLRVAFGDSLLNFNAEIMVKVQINKTIKNNKFDKKRKEKDNREKERYKDDLRN